jgi:hypothetical protein
MTFANLCQGLEAVIKAVTKPQGSSAMVNTLLPPHPAPLVLHGAAVRGAAASTHFQQSSTPLQQSLPSPVTLPGVVCLCVGNCMLFVL